MECAKYLRCHLPCGTIYRSVSFPHLPNAIHIEEDLGLARGSAWLPTANILAIAAVCPYAGYLQDLFGKRYIALFGSFCICLGCALMGSGHSFGQLLAGMAISGAGAATGELTGLAGYERFITVWSDRAN